MDATRYRQPDPGEVAGTVFDGRYRLERLLGMGGMGAVYEAVQLSVDRPVAIKVLKPGLARELRDVARFQQEARAVAALSHPNTIRLFDFGQVEDGSLFLVMELLRGETLEELIAREAPLAPARVAAIALQVAEALVEAHAHGIVHRDLKPPNVFLAEIVGRQDFVKVLDFGIAKVSGDRAAEGPLTSTGVAVGSPRWIAPEQATGELITGQADIYTLGVIAFEMLTGRPLFTGRTATDLLVAHLSAAVPPLAVQGRPLTGPLPDLIRQCLEKLPSARPPGAQAVVEALRAMEGRYLARPERGPEPAATGAASPAKARGPTQEIAAGEGPPASPGSHRQTSRLDRAASAGSPPVGVRTTAFTGPVEVVAFTAPVPALARTGPVPAGVGMEPTAAAGLSSVPRALSHAAPTGSLPAEAAAGATGGMPAEAAAGATGGMPAHAPGREPLFDEGDLAPTVAVPLLTGESLRVSAGPRGGGSNQDEIPTDPDATAQRLATGQPHGRPSRRWPLAVAALAVAAVATFALSRSSNNQPAPGKSDDSTAPAANAHEPLAPPQAQGAGGPKAASDPEAAPEHDAVSQRAAATEAPPAPEAPEAPPEIEPAHAPPPPPGAKVEPQGAPADPPPPRVLRTRLASSPSGARVYEGDLDIGTTPLDYEWLPTTPPPPLTFRAPGRLDVELKPTALVSGGETLVRLRRLPKRGRPRAPIDAPYERTP